MAGAFISKNQQFISSVIRQKGKSEKGGNKKTKHAKEMFIFRKVWRVLFSCYLRF